MKNRRRRNLINPRIQLRFALLFLSASGLSVVLQTLILYWALTRVAEGLPAEGHLLMRQLPAILITNLLIAFAVLTPLTIIAGILSTFRLCGPLHQFRLFLEQVAAGQRTEPCRIRKDDELQDLCALLNRATAPLLEAGEREEHPCSDCQCDREAGAA